ncbi:hypothetical protein DV096_09110 [Bradymonadaceae bacterium TMQ3]|uniref:Lipoprotein n=1 Tax=Lujinxingia sediminis TaxID=2480984 RepID=A0ABY0CT99_9DELT|nr:hypothetical protein [Lujinxingia sediminis]RDV38939.1 hypothetical protein DV096_09110 [Bradymonadaceae bacterium TMQ3]RVU44174.1 hypothetical protein EA187_11550 [Lujinxingia sediminis]TXC76288.1 hypothetical protein FRC91_05960 [Bradymonadales bacterium TMQ1]
MNSDRQQQRPPSLQAWNLGVRATALLALLMISSCGPYRFANDAGRPGRAVAISTIAAPAELGLNTPALQAILADQVFSRGLTLSADAPYRLSCTVSAHRTTGFDGDLVSEVDLRCPLLFNDSVLDVVEAIGVSADALATHHPPSLAALQAVERTEELAAADALAHIATRVAYLVDRHHRNETSP